MSTKKKHPYNQKSCPPMFAFTTTTVIQQFQFLQMHGCIDLIFNKYRIILNFFPTLTPE